MPTKKKLSSKKSKHTRNRSNKFQLLWVAGVAVLLFVAVFAFQKKPSVSSPEITGGPGLKVDKTEVDLGDLKLGNPVQVSFRITNVGDSPLRFSKAPYVEIREGC